MFVNAPIEDGNIPPRLQSPRLLRCGQGGGWDWSAEEGTMSREQGPGQGRGGLGRAHFRDPLLRHTIAGDGATRAPAARIGFRAPSPDTGPHHTRCRVEEVLPCLALFGLQMNRPPRARHPGPLRGGRKRGERTAGDDSLFGHRREEEESSTARAPSGRAIPKLTKLTNELPTFSGLLGYSQGIYTL
jgi:hypothetical protein